MAQSSNVARATWELENNIEVIPAGDEIFRYNADQQKQVLESKPWEKDPHFFKDIKISALALLKMTMHARSGGSLEIMGLLLGKVEDSTMVSFIAKKLFLCIQKSSSLKRLLWMRLLFRLRVLRLE